MSAIVDAARARKANAAILEDRAPELVGAGPDRLDEAQLCRTRGEIVAPQPGDHQHISFGDAPIELLGAANFEARDARIAPNEPLLQPIGDMREADRRLVPGWQHCQVLPSDHASRRSGQKCVTADRRVNTVPRLRESAPAKIEIRGE
jgi:hypothetical protein